MRDLSKVLKNREINDASITNLYKAKILDDQFEVIIDIKNKTSKIIDLSSNEEYVLVDVENAVGEFVGGVREAYENVINSVINKCTYAKVFKNKQSEEVIKYIKEKYNDDLEFLWDKFDDCAIWRNKSNEKWYGILMKVKRSKFFEDSEELVEVIDLRYNKGETEKIVDNKKIFSGYHMNKNSWITIKLDGTEKTKKIFELIDNSYKLSGESKKSKEKKESARNED